MLDQVQEAFRLLGEALEENEALTATLFARWKNGAFPPEAVLPDEQRAAAALIDESMPGFTRDAGEGDCAELFLDASEIVFLWCAASVGEADVAIAGLLAIAAAHPDYVERTLFVARNRVVQGPLRDALACVPLLGGAEEIAAEQNFEARARIEILVWEAGARALQLPAFGEWIWSDPGIFEVVIAGPARGSLRGRVLAARCLETSVCGIGPMTDQQLVGRTLQVLQPLLLHPEPLVWIHAARAFGRLAGTFEPLEGTLLDWVHGDTRVLRQRALTAFASLPAERMIFLGHELESILDSETDDDPAGTLSATAAATPYLFFERRALWDKLAGRVFAGEGGAVAARALARGLATLWRRGERESIEPSLRRLRQAARRAQAESIDDWRRWLETIAVTDPVDDAERDPLDIELGLDNLVRLAAHYDDEEADARAARFARTLEPTFAEAKRVVLGEGSPRHRAAATNALEGCARALALRLWGPMLATRPSGDHISEPDLEEAWNQVARAPEELLDVVKERRHTRSGEHSLDEPLADQIDTALEVLALKIGGYALDAGDQGQGLGPGRGPTAHATCLWLRKLEGLVDGSRELPPSLQRALSSLFWRLVDTTRGTSLGEVDDVEWLGPFAAWWALVIDQPAILQQLGTALPMIASGVLEKCASLAEEIRLLLAGGPGEDPPLEDGKWAGPVKPKLAELRAGETELGEALSALARALGAFAETAGHKPDMEARALDLVMSAERLQAALADPVRALHPASEAPTDDSLSKRTTENAPRMATMVTRAVRTRELSLLDVWFASLGPVTSALVEKAVQASVKRTPPPPPVPKKKQPKTIVGYELLKALGEGGIGSVWLVKKPEAERMFVLKIPKADVLQTASDTEREGILASFTEEAKALAALYHPNVASIIDRGVEDEMPYLVLELLIGADLKMYSDARKMTLFELRKVVLESCAGLTALHNSGLVHRDIKPANLWLRLPLQGGERFDPDKHRDPAAAPPLATVIIDFGMVRAQRVSAEVGGRFVAGTAGYIAPEQVLDPVELDGRADVYALAGTVYNVITGRTFFDDIDDTRQRILAHMRRDPMEDATRFKDFPAGLVKLMRAATAMDFRDRPTPAEFGREFDLLL